MTTMYEACFGKVTPVEVERESKKCVWINGVRRERESNWRPLFDTEKEAWRYLIAKYEAAVVVAKNRVEDAERERGKLMMRIPFETLGVLSKESQEP